MGIAAAPDADAFVRPSELMLDAANPRFTGERLDEQGEVLDFLIENFDVNELVQSILYSGWIDYEPLIVLREGNTVLEGNRRLAALRALADRALRKRMDIRLSARPGPEELPRAIRARYVESRDEARDYIGFKHISGPFEWDPLAKAKYASEWLGDAGDMTAIGRRLRDFEGGRLIPGWFQDIAAEAAAELLGGESISFGWPRPDGATFLPALRNASARLGMGAPLTEAPLWSRGREKDAGVDIIA